ncbi:MAG: CopG family transcriptional regulator [Leptolyngbyaceae cyanobacterium SU_3_3]|nr:CopG family transcriptional regulator [Leptolyngbyaceae cyanobacterium SU_3_3]NJR52471.1 CopG family transcriptional regulator [Leptolyngbyaceae cyanobacterium CSU_1_3]
MKAEVFDQRFDQSEDVTEFLDLENAHRPGHQSQSVTIAFPQWMLDALDREAVRLGVSREAIVKVWLAERLTLLAR